MKTVKEHTSGKMYMTEGEKSMYVNFKMQLKQYGIRGKAITAFCVLVWLCNLPLALLSQTCANYSPVSRTTGITYSSISGSSPNYFIWRNLTSNQNDDNRSYPVNIGFDFWYLGVRYTQISANLNGTIDFSSSTSDGNSSFAAYGYNAANQFSTANGTMLALAPMYADLITNGAGATPIASSIFYNVTGVAPNRVFTVEWLNFDHYNSPINSPNASYNFQVKLYETSGIIKFVYGTMSQILGGAAPLLYTCGINNTWASGSPNATLLLTQQTVNTTTFNSTAVNNLATCPATNSQLTFTPPTPTAAPTGLSFSAISKTGMTLNWTDNATNEVGYAIYNSTDGISYNFVTQTTANSSSSIIASLLPDITYYWKVYAVTDGALSTVLSGSQATNPAGIIVSVSNGNWSANATWNCNCVPTSGDNVTVADGTTVVLDANGACNMLTVGQGLSGPLTIGNSATTRTLAVNTDITINTGATITMPTVNGTHLMTVGGNITNNGTLNLATTAARVCNVTFNKNGNQTISGTGGITNFNLITVNMGTSSANTLDISSTNFTALPTNFLTLINGTLKLSTNAIVTSFTGNVTIPSTTGLWINNASATVSATGGSLTLFGSLRVSAGTFNIGNAANQSLVSNGGTTIIDGGTINVAGQFCRAGLTTLTNFNMSSGTLTVATVGSTTAGLAPFMITETGSTFNMSGGTIIIRRAGAGNLGFVNTGGSLGSISGGTLQIGDASTPAAQTIGVTSAFPINNLTVNSANATAQLQINNLTVRNNVTISAGTLNPNALNISVGGNWTNNATYTTGTSGITFNGTANQTISGSSGTTFYNLTLNNTGVSGSDVITLSQPISVSNTLTLTDGILASSATNLLTLTNSATTATTRGNSTGPSFVTGPIRWNGLNGAGPFIFPTGVGTSGWANVAVSGVTSATDFTAQYFNTAYTNVSSAYLSTAVTPSLTTVSHVEYWDVARTSGTGNAAVTLYWKNASTSYINSCASNGNLKVAHFNTGTNKWENANSSGTVVVTGSCSGLSSGTVKSDVMTSFSPFTFGSGGSGVNPLPIELLNFNAVFNGTTTDISWQTASEINNNYFTVERSTDGINFTTLSIVTSKALNGNSTSVLSYTLNDPNKISGVYYYRLKQTDFDFRYAYSNVVAVTVTKNIDFTFDLAPNPNDGNVMSGFIETPSDGMVTFKIYNMAGNRLYMEDIQVKEGENNPFKFQFKDRLDIGTYIVIVVLNGDLTQKKLMMVTR